MSKKDESGIKKGVLESIQELSELESAYFQKGAVNVLKLLYEQDVTMTNITAERLDKIESRLATCNGFMLGIHIATLQHMQEESLSDSMLKEIAALYDIDFEKIKEVVSTDTLLEVIKKIKKTFT
jgi:hypothetical protein